MDYLSVDPDFNMLSLRDLLAARELFHPHLIHKPNVVATAVGRYRIRKDEPWPNQAQPSVHRAPKQTARTLANSEVRPYSWPSILVFVQQWMAPNQFANVADAVPPAVYMPNGQRVPICVIQVDRDDVRPEGLGNYNYPASVIGGGYPVICDVQGREHVASLACIVTDGHRAYGLTNRHVAGEAGSPIFSLIGGNKQRIGVASALQLSRLPFAALYPNWPGENVYVDLDVGLIDIDDLNHWTTQIYGIGELGELADVDTTNLSLRLIGCPVRAFGAASRNMQGEICALFYRFKSVGGFEYVSDLLIGPRGNRPLGTHPGDSGTLWLIDTGDARTAPQPIAMQWGGQVFLEGTKTASSYALATFLSTVCNQLDISLVRDWNTGLPEYWGAVGHYSIASKAVGKIRNANLKRLMTANLERISFDIDQINKKNLSGLSKLEFVPLADVPDMVWKVGPHKRGGMSSPEHANHFADMDRKLDPPLTGGATLLEICGGKPQNVAVSVWQQYYDAVKQQHPDQEESRGLLPFRAWQIYDEMVAFVRGGEVDKFVCAAGILSHYTGDACQPLHISYMFNGDPDKPIAGTGKDEGKDVPDGTGVHSAYEDGMIDANVPAIMKGIDDRLGASSPWPLVKGGHGAAVAIVGLMQKTFAAITPREIVDTFIGVEDEKPSARAAALWDKLGDRTIDVIADGCFCLAQMWDSAWAEGGGDSSITALDAIDETALEALYQNPAFLRSYTLDTIGRVLKGAPATPPASGRVAPPPASHRRRRN